MRFMSLRTLAFSTLAAFGLVAAPATAFAAITITKAEISAGRLVVQGSRTGTAPSIVLDDQFSTGVVSGNFAFSLLYLPPDCMIDLKGDGGTAGTLTAIVGNCGPRGLSAKGAWSNVTSYFENDVVTNGGSSYRAKRASGNKAPATSPNDWEVLAKKGAAGIQGATGPMGAEGTAGATGPIGPAGSAGPAGAIGPAGATGPEGPQGSAGSSPVLYFGSGPSIQASGNYKFFGPTRNLTLTSTQQISVPFATYSYLATYVNQGANIILRQSFCHQATPQSAVTAFSTIAATTASFTISPDSVYALSGSFEFTAHKPGVAGTITIGPCIRVEPSANVTIDLPKLSHSFYQITE